MGIKKEREYLAVKEQNEVKPPPLYRVVLLNDDFTPMRFVVDVLQRFFAKGLDEAEVIMLKVHIEGRGVCGRYPKDVAATKVSQVSHYAKSHEHPLACTMEEDES